MAYIGHMWFWSGADHAHAQAMLDETRSVIRDLIVAASSKPPRAERQELVALRLMGGYAVAIRDLYYARRTLTQAVQFVVDYTLD